MNPMNRLQYKMATLPFHLLAKFYAKKVSIQVNFDGGGGEICLNSTYTALKCEETNVLPVQEEGPE
jgi:hypothetical protein